MSRVEFPSVANPNIRYRFYGRFFESPATGRGDERLTAFDTYGDGVIQHSPEWTVQPDAYPDFFMSLASHAAGNPDAAKTLDEHWPHGIGNTRARFLLSVKYKEEGKRLYYSQNEEKVSAAESKRHDKRWHEVPSYANATIDSAFGLYYSDNFSSAPVDRWAVAAELANVAADTDGTWFCWADIARLAFGSWAKSIESNALRLWFEAMLCLGAAVVAYRSTDAARRQLECYTHNLANHLERVAEEKSATAESA